MACPGATTPSNSPNPQEIAQASVKLLADAWKGTADACVAAGESARKACQPVLDKAKPAIIAAANAVDAWDAVSQQNWPCLARSAVNILQQAMTLVPSLVLPDIVNSALGLVNSYATGYCPSVAADAGVQ